MQGVVTLLFLYFGVFYPQDSQALPDIMCENCRATLKHTFVSLLLSCDSALLPVTTATFAVVAFLQQSPADEATWPHTSLK